MAFQAGVKFKCVLGLAAVFLIMLIRMEDKHEALTDLKISYTKKLNQLKKVSGSPVQYVAVAELTVPLSFPKSNLEEFINGVSFPVSLQNSTEITAINITAVCEPSLTGVQCVCEHQHVWAYNICLAFPVCDYLYAGACGCVEAKPRGQICSPRHELPTIDFTIRIDVIASASLINLVKTYLQTPVHTPYPVSQIMQVSNINISTECSSNNGGYQCKCEDHYFWPCEKCLRYGHCDNITNTTCGCINGFPKDKQFCQSMTELTNAPACNLGTSTQSPTTAGTTVPLKGIIRTISMTINEVFDSTLTSITSDKYKLFSGIIKRSVDRVYQNSLPSYKAGSVTDIQFRPGSVISDFKIVTTSKTLNFNTANLALASALSAEGLSVNADSFAETVENQLYDLKRGKIYPGKSMDLTCNPPDPSIKEITWSKNGNIIKNSDKYQIKDQTLTVTSTTENDNGNYACKMTFNSMQYISFQKMSILPLPGIATNTSNTLRCDGLPIKLECCAEISYTVQWSPTPTGQELMTDQQTACQRLTQNVTQADCENSNKIQTFTCEVRDNTGAIYDSKVVTITLTSNVGAFSCFSPYGAGTVGERKDIACDGKSVGNKTVLCTNSNWEIVEDNCVLRVLQGLVDRAKMLRVEDVPTFIEEVLNATNENAGEITGSAPNIVAVVSLLNSTATVSQSFKVAPFIMKDFLNTVEVVGSINAQKTWLKLNTRNTTEKTSSILLNSTENMGKILIDGNFSITTASIQLNRTSTNGPFSGTFGKNSTTQIIIPNPTTDMSITTIVFPFFDNVLPVRNTKHNMSNTYASINADVTAVIVNKAVNNISFTLDIKNTSFRNPQCVFWNFSLLDGIGGWDSTGCEVKINVNNTDQVTCECTHTTSFSILMSPFVLNSLILDFITYIGVGISMICLILSLIIEGIIWKSMTRNDTSYMRHVSIVNIALSLLIADICFVIGAGIVEKGQVAPVGPCSTATFFMHFLYLALFFWMLLSALLLLYRTVVVFAGMSRAKMMIIAFFVGYGAPLLIAVITVAATAGRSGYIVERSACWLNWDTTRAFLAFVVPALTIVVINLVVLFVVLYKMLRRGVGATTQPDEKQTIVVIARCVAILTPLFGLTWGFGIGTMVSGDLGIHIVFAILNSLQGFFILVFAILLDSKVREELAGKLRIRTFSSGQTRTTSTGPSSSSGPGLVERFRRRNVYHVTDNS